jgi:hypothetical protein
VLRDDFDEDRAHGLVFGLALLDPKVVDDEPCQPGRWVGAMPGDVEQDLARSARRQRDGQLLQTIEDVVREP